jgi:hypothetical protein
MDKRNQKARRTLGRKMTPGRVGKRPVRLLVIDRKQQTQAERRRMGNR